MKKKKPTTNGEGPGATSRSRRGLSSAEAAAPRPPPVLRASHLARLTASPAARARGKEATRGQGKREARRPSQDNGRCFKDPGGARAKASLLTPAASGDGCAGRGLSRGSPAGWARLGRPGRAEEGPGRPCAEREPLGSAARRHGAATKWPPMVRSALLPASPRRSTEPTAADPDTLPATRPTLFTCSILSLTLTPHLFVRP